MKLELYLETETNHFEKVDLYDDESIVLNYKLKDISDISKVFSTFTQTFSIPSSDNNNRILGFYFNTSMPSFTKKRYISAKIYINSLLFKTGKVIIESGKVEYYKLNSYSLKFFTIGSTLKAMIGDDTINEMAFPVYNFSWTTTNFYFNINTTNADAFVPLISTKRVWEYNSGTNNIKYINSTTTSPKPIEFTELRPALRYNKVFENIFLHYGLNVSSLLFDEDKFKKLFVHLTNENIPMDKQVLDIQNNVGGYVDIGTPTTHDWNMTVNTTDNTFNIIPNSLSTTQVGIFSYSINPTSIVDSNNSDITTTVDFVDMRPTSPTYGSVIISQEKAIAINGTIKGSIPINVLGDFNIQPTNPFIFKVEVKFNKPVKYFNFTGGLVISKLNNYYYSKSTSNNTSNLNSIINLFTVLPPIKVIDFLSSFFKMFNIRVAETRNGDGLIFYTPENFIGVDEDYTDYVLIDEATITPNKLYNKYLFSHSDSKYRSNIDYAKAVVNNPSSHHYGELIYLNTDDYLNESYEVKTNYSIVPNIAIPNTSVYTQYGFNSDAGTADAGYGTIYKPNYNELNLFYRLPNDSLRDTNGQPISFGYRDTTTGAETTRIVSAYTQTCISDTDVESTYTNSLGFKDEVSSGGFVCKKNLFSNYYAKTIEEINNNTFFLHTFEAYLPDNKIYDFDLRNNIIIGNQKYRVEEANIDLITGKTKLKLLNII